MKLLVRHKRNPTAVPFADREKVWERTKPHSWGSPNIPESSRHRGKDADGGNAAERVKHGHLPLVSLPTFNIHLSSLLYASSSSCTVSVQFVFHLATPLPGTPGARHCPEVTVPAPAAQPRDFTAAQHGLPLR